MRTRMLKALQGYGRAGEVFQFSDVRDYGGAASTDKKKRNRAWNLWRGFQKAGLMEEVKTDRARNRFYRVEDLERIELILSGGQRRRSETSTGTRPATSSNRLARIEAALGRIETRVDELSSVPATSNKRVEELIENLLAILS